MQEQAEGRRCISMQRNTNCALHATHRRLGALRQHAALLLCAKIRHAAAAIVEARSGLASSEEEEGQYGLALVATEAHVELDAAAAHRRQQYARLRCAQHLVIASKLLSSPQPVGCCGCTWRGLSGRCAPPAASWAPHRRGSGRRAYRRAIACAAAERGRDEHPQQLLGRVWPARSRRRKGREPGRASYWYCKLQMAALQRAPNSMYRKKCHRVRRSCGCAPTATIYAFRVHALR